MVDVRRSRISGSTSATSAAVRRPVRRITVWNWSSAARQPRHPPRCLSIRLRWSPLTSPSRYVVTMSTSSMHLGSSAGESLSVVIACCSPRRSAPSVGGRGREPAGVAHEVDRPIRLTDQELRAHPRWRNFGEEVDDHPPLRGWLAVPLLGSDGANYGFIQASDRLEGDFTEQDEANLVRLAALTSTALDALAQLHLADYRRKVAEGAGE
jgi:GAF domain-containing protein